MTQPSRSYNPYAIGLLVVAVACFAFVAYRLMSNDNNPDNIGSSDLAQRQSGAPAIPVAKQPSLNESLGVEDTDLVEIGGVKRPTRDVAFPEKTGPQQDTDESPFPHPGNAPAVAKDTNPQVKGLFEELSQDSVPPAAASAMIAPEAFDKQKYEADKATWLGQIRPGRAFQSAPPGADVQPIKSKTPAFQQVVQGEKVILEVEAEPGAPVTFYTPQVGEFENRLTTQSVEATEDGIARVTYAATPGTLGLVDIVAASPLNSGQSRFRVRVLLPE